MAPPRPGRSRRIALVAIAGLCVGVVAGAGASAMLPGPAAVAFGGPPRFVDETVSAGVAHVYGGDFSYATGGGVAVFDCDADGKPDLYLAGGAAPAALYRNDSPVGGSLRFTRLPDPATDLTGATGAYPVDIDGDGKIDVAVLRNGEDVLLRGLGGCRFERANERWGYHGGSSVTTAFSAKWSAGDALPTMAFGSYVDPASSDPHHLCSDNALVRPAQSTARFEPPVPLVPSWCALSMLFSDWDRSGRVDLRVSNDLQYYLATDGEEQLWRVPARGAPSLYTADDGWVRTQINGMGIASYDLTGDGYPEIFLTSQGDNKLQTLASGPATPMYRDIGQRRGVNAAQPFTGGDAFPSTAWHAEFADVNNDGFVDLFIAKGNVGQQVGYAQRDPSELLLGRADGTFQQGAAAAGIVNFDKARGAALADFNLDGMLDLVVASYGTPVRVWRNVGVGTPERPRAMGGWLGVRLSQPGPNVNAIGAWVEVRVGDRISRREITIGGGHAGGQLGWIHFGLGDATAADVRVIWPGGDTGGWVHVSADQFLIPDRTTGTAKRWSPG